MEESPSKRREIFILDKDIKDIIIIIIINIT